MRLNWYRGRTHEIYKVFISFHVLLECFIRSNSNSNYECLRRGSNSGPHELWANVLPLRHNGTPMIIISSKYAQKFHSTLKLQWILNKNSNNNFLFLT